VILQQQRWGPGTRLVVKDMPNGVLLAAMPLFAPTRPEDVFGSLPSKGQPKTLEGMKASISTQARQRCAGD
jgi:hypothetical protein